MYYSVLVDWKWLSVAKRAISLKLAAKVDVNSFYDVDTQ